MRLPFAFLCLFLFLPALSACGDSGSTSAGPYAAYQGTWELDEGEYLTRITYDLPSNRITLVSASKDGPAYSFMYIFAYTAEIKGDTLRITQGFSEDDPGSSRTEELKMNADGTLSSTVTLKTTLPVNPIPQATFTRPNKAHDGLFAKIVPAGDKMEGEWLREDWDAVQSVTKKMAARINMSTGKVDLFGREAEDLEKKSINAISYTERLDPKFSDPFSTRLLFEDYQGKRVYIKMDDPAKTPLKLWFFIGRGHLPLIKK